jgi:DNA-binding NtrC family response regulator
LSDDAKAYLNSHSWPGNVRELENACKRAQVFANGHCLVREDFTDKAVNSTTNQGAHYNENSANNLIQNEKEQIEAALIKYRGVIKSTALELALSRQALYRRIEKYNIDVDSLC